MGFGGVGYGSVGGGGRVFRGGNIRMNMGLLLLLGVKFLGFGLVMRFVILLWGVVNKSLRRLVRFVVEKGFGGLR